MKKFLVFIFLVIPTLTFAVPSVRVLGNNSTAKAVANTGTKITPAKATGNTNASIGTSTSRIGTLRAKAKTTGTSGALINSNTRFPIISAPQSYNSVATPKSDSVIGTVSGADTDAIVNTIVQYVENNYYNKEEIYNNNEFIQAVKDVDDPRIDAIKVGSKPVHKASLPSDYVYIWIEE